VNTCRACGSDFTSLETFDAHRVGTHEYTFNEGLKFEPPVEDGRRCLNADEMREKGWAPDDKGRWVNTARAERARRAFAKEAA
jgi:hypothetical protein